MRLVAVLAQEGDGLVSEETEVAATVGDDRAVLR